MSDDNDDNDYVLYYFCVVWVVCKGLRGSATCLVF